jgi:hypothetical protein
MPLAPKALYHGSLGHRPRNLIIEVSAQSALQWGDYRNDDRTKMAREINRAFSAGTLLGTANLGAMPQAQDERCAFWR